MQVGRPMDRFYYELIGTPTGAIQVAAVQQIIDGHAVLGAVAEPWRGPGRPLQADLYALLVAVSDDVAADQGMREKIVHACACNFPIIPIVTDLATYDFTKAPIPELSERNAEGLAAPDRLLRSLLHHAGAELFDGGGHVFISYARADGSDTAEAVRAGLKGAGIGQSMDIYAFAGGDVIQDDIERRIAKADLVIVIDSKGASKSDWVAEEIDLALAAHVSVIAVSPVVGAFRHMFQVPHVEWTPGDLTAAQVVHTAKRLLAKKYAFRTRVARILARLANLKDWHLIECGDRWRLLTKEALPLTIGYVHDSPRVEAVTTLRQEVAPARGLLVAGVRPLRPVTLQGLSDAGRPEVAITTLLTLASRIPAGLAKAPLSGRRVFLSAAMPSDAEEVELARTTLSRFVVGLTQALVDLGAVLVFGGHPSVTPLVHQALAHLNGPHAGHVELHLGRYWRGDGLTIPVKVREGPVYQHVFWHGDGADAAADVSAMRDGMICADLDAAVFAGGKTSGYIGPKPGVIDEFERFAGLGAAKPSFVVGLAGGAARTIKGKERREDIALMSTGDPDLAVGLIVAELLKI